VPLIVKQFDTYPPWVLTFNDENGWTNLTSANLIKLIGKLTGGTLTIGPVTCTKVTEIPFTASTTVNTPVLRSLSSLTGLSEGTTIVGPAIPLLTYVVSVDTTGGTVTMSNPASASEIGASMVAGRGMATYTPTATDTGSPGLFNLEGVVHWDVGGTMIQKFPNSQQANPQLQIDPDLTGVAE
jgi:hypothetical protein